MHRADIGARHTAAKTPASGCPNGRNSGMTRWRGARCGACARARRAAGGRLQGLRQDQHSRRHRWDNRRGRYRHRPDDGQALRDALVDALARELDAAAVDPARLRQEAQQPPSPQPTSRILAPCSTMLATTTSRHARRPACGPSAMVRSCLSARASSSGHRRQAARLGGAVQEAAHDRKQLRLEQKCIVALVGDDFSERDARRRH